MNTAYKTRGWWICRSLQFAIDSVRNLHHNGNDFAGPAQCAVWSQQAAKCAANACAETGATCLTRQYRDPHGDLLGGVS